MGIDMPMPWKSLHGLMPVENPKWDDRNVPDSAAKCVVPSHVRSYTIRKYRFRLT